MSLNVSDLIMGRGPNPDLENADDVSSDSDYEPPFLQPVSKEELRIARSLKRTQKKAEKHAKADVFKRMGDELYSKDNFEEAYIPYLEATQIWPSNVDYYNRLAMTYAKLGWYEEAAHASTRALTLDPKSLEARYLRGMVRLEQRLLTAAKTDLEVVVTHDPTHKKAEEALNTTNKSLEARVNSSQDTAEPNSIQLDFSYPQYDDAALEVDTLSNTSDSNHRGNGVPCRFYNREGCAKASLCPYSHAPDEKSVRDDLGRNVCIYFLLDSCKFGNGKCVYSHSRLYLPKSGWWTSVEETAKVKAILELSEKTAKERRSHAAQLQMLDRRSKPSKGLKSGVAKTPRIPKVAGGAAPEGAEANQGQSSDRKPGKKAVGTPTVSQTKAEETPNTNPQPSDYDATLAAATSTLSLGRASTVPPPTDEGTALEQPPVVTAPSLGDGSAHFPVIDEDELAASADAFAASNAAAASLDAKHVPPPLHAASGPN